MRFPPLLGCAALLCASAHFAVAHHGKDFLIVESYDVPHPGDVYAISSAAIATLNGETALEFEPSLLIGIAPRLAFELHAHTGKEPDGSFRYEATAPAVHFQITPPDSTFPVRVGLSAEYEFAAHHDEADRVEERLVLESSFGSSRVAVNIIGAHKRHVENALDYAIGYRYAVNEKFSFGAEAEGPTTHQGVHELLAGVYIEPNHHLTLKAGIGPGFDSESGGTAFLARLAAVIGF